MTLLVMYRKCSSVHESRSVRWNEELKLFSEGYGKGKSWDDLMVLAHNGSLTGVILHDIAKWHGKGEVLSNSLAILNEKEIPISVALMDYTEVNVATLQEDVAGTLPEVLFPALKVQLEWV